MTGERDERVVSPLVRGLASDEERSVVSRAVSRRLRKGQTLFLEGEPAEALYQVRTGRLRLSQVTPGGQVVTVRFTGPGEVCAALAVLDGKTYPFSAAAVEATLVLLWSRGVLRELFQSHPRLERNVLDVVGIHAREALDKFRELATEPVPRRLARTLLRLIRLGGPRREGGIVLERVRQRDLAEIAATSPYTVNRVLAAWESRGIVEKRRAGVVIHSEARLRKIAGA
jgi:CRP/FNR family transcriptional regulator, nitrogen oxide reductase regulator